MGVWSCLGVSMTSSGSFWRRPVPPVPPTMKNFFLPIRFILVMPLCVPKFISIACLKQQLQGAVSSTSKKPSGGGVKISICNCPDMGKINLMCIILSINTGRAIYWACFLWLCKTCPQGVRDELLLCFYKCLRRRFIITASTWFMWKINLTSLNLYS